MISPCIKRLRKLSSYFSETGCPTEIAFFHQIICKKSAFFLSKQCINRQVNRLNWDRFSSIRRRRHCMNKNVAISMEQLVDIVQVSMPDLRR